MPNNRKQVWLMKRLCYAAIQEQLHEGHIFQVMRKPFESSDNQKFWCYLYCDGFIVSKEEPASDTK